MRYSYPQNQTIRYGAAGVRNNPKNPRRAGAARKFSWLLWGILLAGTPHSSEALGGIIESIVSIVQNIITSILCQIPYVNLPKCSELGCTNNAACNAGYYCSKLTCGSPRGICTARPTSTSCPLPDNPVCGCNDQTYGNDCLRKAAGVNKVKNSPCGQICTAANASTACAAKAEFCDLVLTTCDTTSYEYAMATGKCVLINNGTESSTTSNCPAPIAFVCGCNGKSYPTDCNRIRERVDKAGNGQCCTVALGCYNDQEEFCETQGNNCSATVGICVKFSKECATEITQAVCGCDNKPYPSDCFRQKNRTSQQKEGQC